MQKNLIGILLVLLAAGCGEWGEEEEGRLVSVPDNVCTSGLQWQGGDEESTLMHPGRDCIECHATSGEGPSYGIAGTVFREVDEPDDCAGVSGATIEIVDANGTVTALTSNHAGNFYLSSGAASSIVLPYTANVVTENGTRSMVTAQSVGSCNSCHQRVGLNGAPGRIQVP